MAKKNKIPQTTKEIILIRVLSSMIEQGYKFTKKDIVRLEKSMDSPEHFGETVKKIIKKNKNGDNQ